MDLATPKPDPGTRRQNATPERDAKTRPRKAARFTGPAHRQDDRRARLLYPLFMVFKAPHTSADTIHPDPIRIDWPEDWTVPLVVASPHSGNRYPDALIAQSPLPLNRLRSSEDCFVDEIFASAPALGAPLLQALFPRALVDVNREPWELDPTMFSETLPDYVTRRNARISAGLGTIARVVSNGERIYTGKLPFAEAERRIRTYYEPYHRALAMLIEEACARFGHCILLDCHSMPSGAAMRPGQARRKISSDAGDAASAQGREARAGDGKNRSVDIVLGDRHATACDPLVTATAERVLARSGYLVRRNTPYAGGFVTCNYGRPREDVHALQIEISRTLYMDEDKLERLACIGDVTRDMTGLITALGQLDLTAAPEAEAAE